MEYVTLKINDREIKAKKGQKLLWTALDNGLYIPNLCAIRQSEVHLASCRLCFVEIEGRSGPVTACTTPVEDGMVVYLDTPRVQRLRNTAFELLLSNHKIDCRNCARNGSCELQKIAAKTGLKLRLSRFESILQEMTADYSHELFTYEPDKCILCGKCVWACREYCSGILEFTYRGVATAVSTFYNTPLSEAECKSCLACVTVCPVGVLTTKPGVSAVEMFSLASAGAEA